MFAEKLKTASRSAVAKTDPSDPFKYLPLWMHSLDTAMLMERLYLKWLAPSERDFLEDEAEGSGAGLCRFLGVTHDIGKLTALFQSRVAPCIEGYAGCFLPVPSLKSFDGGNNVPHALAGKNILICAGCGCQAAGIVGLHHGRAAESLYRAEDEILNYEYEYCGGAPKEWRASWDEFIKASLEFSGFEDISQIPQLSQGAQMLLSGMLIMADWLASNQSYFPYIAADSSGDCGVYPKRVSDGWKKIGLTRPWHAQCFNIDSVGFKERFGFEPNSFQKDVAGAAAGAADMGLLVLEAQMGIGKTEAALAAAEILAANKGCGGIFFGLPTQATANGLFPRILSWADYQSADEVHGIRLAHGAAGLNEDFQRIFRGTANIAKDDSDGGVIAHSWFEGRKQGLLAEFVVGTVDQLLMAGLRQKHMMLRHLGLAGKTVVIDECHSYSPYMNRYLDRCLTWLGEYGAPVIILSATLPEERRESMVKAYLKGKSHGKKLPAQTALIPDYSYPRITWTDGETVCQKPVKGDSRQTEVSIIRAETAGLADILKERLSAGGCAAVIVNTVKRAQQTAEILKNSLEDTGILLFHSQFIMDDRAKREKELISMLGRNGRRPFRMVVVGTQVLEQSLDIDFDLMVTDLCPMDLLLQRIGRLHRHRETKRPDGLKSPICYVLGTDKDNLEPGACAIYGQWLLLQTEKRLGETVCLPRDIPQLVQETYKKPDSGTLSGQEKDAWEEYEKRKKEEEARAGRFLLGPPSHAKASREIGSLLTAQAGDSEQSGQAGVRGGDILLEVLVLVKKPGGKISFINGEKEFYADTCPSWEDCADISKQRLRLASAFSRRWNVDRVISQLEKDGFAVLREWMQSSLLKDELFLVLNENGEGELGGYKLKYTKENGLSFEKGDMNERN